MMNSSVTRLVLGNSGTGSFRFTSNESFTLEISYSNLRVILSGDQGNDGRDVVNGSSYTVSATNIITVSWFLVIQPYVPYMFIIGMVGLGAMFVGPIVAIKNIKENPRVALTMGVTLTALGIGLFMAWLGAG